MNTGFSVSLFFGIVVFLLLSILSGIRILTEYQRAVVFRIGRYKNVKGPGLIFVIPIIDRIEIVELRTVTLDIPIQEVITKDNIPVKVNAVCYFHIQEPSKTITKVLNYRLATSQIAQTSLRSVCGEVDLDTILTSRTSINLRLQETIDELACTWGVKINTVELKDVQIPESMQRAFASQAEAERERRAKVIAAEGEFQAAQKLSEAAQTMQKNPIALKLRYLQTIKESASGSNNITLIPLPTSVFDLLKKISAPNKK